MISHCARMNNEYPPKSFAAKSTLIFDRRNLGILRNLDD
jgi:hypothetical protein